MAKYRLGYTAGAFDLFHVGHLNILKRAKGLCETLLVGVSTDKLIIDYKGKPPAIPFEDRMRIVEAIKYVDIAIPQQYLDRYEAWRQLKFNVAIVGNDWYNVPSWNEYQEKLEKVGVDIVYLPYTEGISTTSLKKKLAIPTQ